VSRTVVVVVNPSKLGDPAKFKAAVGSAMAEHGWSEPGWRETTPTAPIEHQPSVAACHLPAFGVWPLQSRRQPR
jgi:hypothetical protein